MKMLDSAQSYGAVSRFFHWLLFLMIIGALIGGWVESEMADGPEKARLVALHKSFGATILLLVVARLLWRLTTPTPRPAPELPPWQVQASRIVHWSLYACMLAQPLSGLTMSQAAGQPVDYFGLFTLPSWVGPDETLAERMYAVHQAVSTLLAVLILGHAGAALYHHFIRRDRVLRRML